MAEKSKFYFVSILLLLVRNKLRVYGNAVHGHERSILKLL